MSGKHEKRPGKHSFLRRVVRLCLVMMVLLTLAAVAMSAVAGAPPDAGSLGVLMGGWCGELLLTLLKRKFEQEDKAEAEAKAEAETGDGSDPVNVEGEEEDPEIWSSGR